MVAVERHRVVVDEDAALCSARKEPRSILDTVDVFKGKTECKKQNRRTLVIMYSERWKREGKRAAE